MRWRLQPLGVDLGSARARVAVTEAASGKGIRLRAVVASDVPDELETPVDVTAAIVEDLVSQLGCKTRRCVAALGLPEGSVRSMRFPRMGPAERRRAARLNASQMPDEEEEAIVRVHPLDRASSLYAVASARHRSLKRLTAILRSARLRPLGIDHDGCALARAFHPWDAVIDVGRDRTRIHLLAKPLPESILVAFGGARVTRAIAADLSIDVESAERRKRILGLAGAAETTLGVFADRICEALRGSRGAPGTWRRLALVGNGARLAGFARAVSERLGAPAEVPIHPFLRREALEDHALASGAPDWSLAASLTSWNAA